MATETLTKRLTYEEWLELPETDRPYEIVDGVMQVAAAPTSVHQWIILNIVDILRAIIRPRGLGVVLVAPVDVVIQREPLRTRQPDVLFLSAERTGVRGIKELKQMPVIEIAPDLVVEVLSPGDTRGESRRGVQEKLEDYRRLGVHECWLVSPEAETLEVLRLTAEGIERVGLFGIGDTVPSEVLPDLAFMVDEVFA